MMASSPTMYLRVKRPRHVDPPSVLCVDLDSSKKRAKKVENLAHLLHQSTYIQQQQQQQQQTHTSTHSTAIWKRVDNNDAFTKESNHNTQKRSFQYVNAVLDNVEQQDEDGPQLKRPRLALTLVQDPNVTTSTTTTEPSNKSNTTKKKPKHNKIVLDPRSRLVQTSLEKVLSGELSIQQHVSFLSQDSRLCDTPRVWLAWQDVASGNNVLHAATLWNDLEGASSILAWNVPSLLTAVNHDGQTPYQVAVAVGHTQVADVLRTTSVNDESDDSDEDDYVYDVFQLDSDMNDGDEIKTDNNETPTSVELRGGIGYWNEDGHLILEALEEVQQDDSSDNDDEDSNCEDYYPNDYPEEEEEWENDSEEEEETSFRHRPIYFSSPNARVEAGPTLVEDEDEEYDAQYDMYEPDEPERLYAYDAELEETSDDE